MRLVECLFTWKGSIFMQIAIDGPASSGKSTIAKMLAKDLGIIYIDTGAMYRAVTLDLLNHGIDLKNIADILQRLSSIELTFKRVKEGNLEDQHIFLNQVDVEDEIRSTKVTQNVSELSAIKEVRDHLVNLQRQLASSDSVVMEGRDIGSVVLPKADYKFYFTASPEVRAKRRLKDNMERGIDDQDYEAILQAIKDRDAYDSNRKNSPLTKAEGAIEIDGSDMTLEEVLVKIKNIIRERN